MFCLLLFAFVQRSPYCSFRGFFYWLRSPTFLSDKRLLFPRSWYFLMRGTYLFGSSFLIPLSVRLIRHFQNISYSVTTYFNEKQGYRVSQYTFIVTSNSWNVCIPYKGYHSKPECLNFSRSLCSFLPFKCLRKQYYVYLNASFELHGKSKCWILIASQFMLPKVRVVLDL